LKTALVFTLLLFFSPAVAQRGPVVPVDWDEVRTQSQMLVDLYGQLLSAIGDDNVPASQKTRMMANSYNPRFPRSIFLDGKVKIEYDLSSVEFENGSRVYQEVDDYLRAFELLFNGKGRQDAVETRFLGCKTFLGSYAGVQVVFEMTPRGVDRSGNPFGTSRKLMETIALHEDSVWKVYIKGVTHYSGTLDGFSCMSEERKPYEKDSDTDGVPDSRDECPNEFGFRTISGCPDDDLDGVPNIYDKCPGMAGPKTKEGCPDNDNDGLPDHLDKCPYQAGIPQFEGCPDSDEDGIPDKEDRCRFAAGTAEFQGCPDKDGDGIPDLDDNCPFVAGVPEYGGCPAPDSDGDGIVDSEDLCPLEKGTPRLKGCPDQDGDGVADKDDRCIDEKGPSRYKGCPDSDGDGVPNVDDNCPLIKGNGKFAGCPVLYRPGTFLENSYFAINYQLVNRPWSRYRTLGLSNFGRRWDNFAAKTSEDFRFRDLEHFGIAFYAPVGGYLFGFKSTRETAEFEEYTLSELNKATEDLIDRGWEVEKPEFYDFGFSGRILHAGIVLGPFYKLRYLRHVFLTAGMTVVRGKNWSEYKADFLGFVPPSYGENIYAADVMEFDNQTHPELGLALVFPYGHTEFTYFNYMHSFSWKIGVNLPIRLLVKK